MSDDKSTTRLPDSPGIYKISCLITGKCYIGSAVSLKRRWKEHRVTLGRGAHASPRLQRAWNKYGKDAFTIEILEHIEDPLMLLTREQAWMDLTMCYLKEHGYNILPIAGSPLGTTKSDETKAKIGAAHRGRKHTPEARAKMSEAKRGKKPIAAIAAMVASRLGKKQSEETKAKRSAALKGRPLSPETKAKLSLAALRRHAANPRKSS